MGSPGSCCRHLIFSPVTHSMLMSSSGIDWAAWFLMIYLSHKGASSTSNMLAPHHFSSQSSTTPRAGPDVTLGGRDLGLRIIRTISLDDYLCTTSSLYLPDRFLWRGPWSFGSMQWERYRSKRAFYVSTGRARVSSRVRLHSCPDIPMLYAGHF